MAADAREDGPKTFEALLGKDNGTKLLPTCSRCGDAATHKLSLIASRPNFGHKGPGGKPGTNLARHSNYLCEPCAVAVFASFRKAIR